MGTAKRKFSTVIDERLLRQTKLESVRRNKKINEIIGEALEAYLFGPGHSTSAGSVAATWASIPLDRETARRLATEDDESLFAD